MSSTAASPGLSADQIDWLMITANCLMTQKYPERAAVLLDFLLCFEPENPRAQQMLGYCCHLAGRHEEALTRLRALDPTCNNPINALLQAKTLMALDRGDEAARAFNQFSRTREDAQ